jgi:hypothetical protein
MSAPLSEMLRAHHERELVPPSALLPGGLAPRFVALLDAVIARACARDPAHRFPNAASMLDALDGGSR